MLSKINNHFELKPPPTKKNKKIIATTEADVHRPSDEEIINSSGLSSDKGGDYAKIASDAPGASTSGDSKQFVPMGSFTIPSKVFPNIDEMTKFCSDSPKPFQEYSELMIMQRKDSNTNSNSSDTAPYLENHENMPSSDSPPYLENENDELLAASNANKEHSYDCIAKGHTGNFAPSIMLSSQASESSSANFQGEGYVSEENAILLIDNIGCVTGINHSQLTSNYQANQNSTSGLVTTFDRNKKDGQYISQTTLDNILAEIASQQQTTRQDSSHNIVKISAEGSSSVDSDCLDCHDNSSIDV